MNTETHLCKKNINGNTEPIFLLDRLIKGGQNVDLAFLILYTHPRDSNTMAFKTTV